MPALRFVYHQHSSLETLIHSGGRAQPTDCPLRQHWNNDVTLARPSRSVCVAAPRQSRRFRYLNYGILCFKQASRRNSQRSFVRQLSHVPRRYPSFLARVHTQLASKFFIRERNIQKPVRLVPARPHKVRLARTVTKWFINRKGNGDMSRLSKINGETYRIIRTEIELGKWERVGRGKDGTKEVSGIVLLSRKKMEILVV